MRFDYSHHQRTETKKQRNQHLPRMAGAYTLKQQQYGSGNDRILGKTMINNIQPAAMLPGKALRKRIKPVLADSDVKLLIT